MSSPINMDTSHFSIQAPGTDAIEMVGLRAEIKLWLDRPFNEYPAQFLEAFEWFASRLGPQFRWYQNYTMNRFAPVTANTLSSPQVWLKKGRQDVARMLYVKGPEEMKAAGQYALHFKYHPDAALYSKSNTPFLRGVTPASLLARNHQSYLDVAQQLGDLLPFLCGHVGYSLETSPYFENQAYRAAFPLAMRHPGVYIASDLASWSLRDEKGVETVNWLTLVGAIPLARVGGAAALRSALAHQPEIEVIETAHGVIVKAGNEPQLGDVNRGVFVPLYSEVYRALKPVIEPVIADANPLLLGGVLEEDAEKTQRWLHRFDR